MATEVLTKYGTQLRFCVTADLVPADDATNLTISGQTDVALTLSGVVSGAARQSAKANLGATRASRFEVLGSFDFTGETPSATGHVALYWAPSTSATAANGNVAGNSGLDAACPDGALGSITLAEFLKQCQYIGELPTHDGAVVQNGLVNPSFSPSSRYGQLIVVNNAGDDFEALNTQMAVWFNPIIDEAQN